MKHSLCLGSTVLLAVMSTPANAGPDDRTVAAIVDEGTNRSQAMLTASELMDGIGPRLTNSDGYRRAEAWALARMRSLGLSAVHTEGFRFGLESIR